MKRIGGSVDTPDGKEFHTVTKILLWKTVAFLSDKLNVRAEDFADDPDPNTQFFYRLYLWYMANETRENRKQVIGSFILFVIKVFRNDVFFRERIGGMLLWLFAHQGEFVREAGFDPDRWYPKLNRIHYLVHDKKV